jgi:cell division protein ZapA
LDRKKSELSEENKVVVRIFGEEYPITGLKDPAYISKVADFVDARMQEVARQSRAKARDKVAILTALSLASELMEQSNKIEEDASESSSSLDNLLARLDNAICST